MARTVIIVPDQATVVRESVILNALHRGESIASIAARLGVTPPTVHNHLRRMGFGYSRTQGWRRRNGAD